MKNNLGEIRNRRGITQEEMARRLGVKKRTYGAWERDEREFNAEQLLQCAIVLDCSCDEILMHEMPPCYESEREGELHRTYISVSSDERHVIDAYRSSSDEAKGIMLDMADSAIRSSEMRAQKNEGIA